MKPSLATTSKTIIHIRLDSFLTALVEKENPSWQNRPIVIEQYIDQSNKRQNQIVSANAVAQKLGIRPGDSTDQATQRIPWVIRQQADLIKAKDYSQEFFSILYRFSNNIEPVRLDEAFIELNNNNFAHGSPVDFAASLQRIIHQELGLSSSIGIGSSKIVAWAASAYKRPNGLTYIPKGDEQIFLFPKNLDQLYTLGIRSRTFLITHGISSIGQLASSPTEWLVNNFGSIGADFKSNARGYDSQPFEIISDAKSLSRTLRFDAPVTDQFRLLSTCHHLLDKSLTALIQDNKKASVIILRFEDLWSRTHQKQIRLTPHLSFNQAIEIAFHKLKVKNSHIKSISVELRDLSPISHTKPVYLWKKKQMQSAWLGLQWRLGSLSNRIVANSDLRLPLTTEHF
ncbi:MAG: hypothetical protein V1853_00480 [bacterium]